MPSTGPRFLSYKSNPCSLTIIPKPNFQSLLHTTVLLRSSARITPPGVFPPNMLQVTGPNRLAYALIQARELREHIDVSERRLNSSEVRDPQMREHEALQAALESGISCTSRHNSKHATSGMGDDGIEKVYVPFSRVLAEASCVSKRQGHSPIYG